MNEPRVAILTVTTNAANHLPAYFDALETVSYPNWTLTIVDNASSDTSVEIIQARRPDATLIRNDSNLGFTGACNRALKTLRDDLAVDYVLFLNDDTEVTPGFLEPLVQLADSMTLVAPKTYLAGRTGALDDAAGEFDWWRGTWKRRVLGREETPADNRAREIDNANLSCLLIPREAFNEVGLLDDAFFVYYDDTDFCRRAIESGYRIVYEPQAVVHHRKGATLGGQVSAFGCYYLSRNRPYLMRKHLSLPRFALFWMYFMATRSARIVIWLGPGTARPGRRHTGWHARLSARPDGTAARHFPVQQRQPTIGSHMTIAVVTIRLRLPSRTLKEKRTIVKSVVERLRNRFNASVAEIEDLDSPGLATIAAAVLSNESRHADRQAQEIAGVVEGWRLDAEVLDVSTELIDI